MSRIARAATEATESEITNLERSLKLGNGELWQKYQDFVANDPGWGQVRRVKFLRQWKTDHAAWCAAYCEQRATAQRKQEAR